MPDALLTLRKLPPEAYGFLDGNPVRINRGGSAVPTHRDPTVMNHHLGVSDAQRAAMECGVTFGWDARSADPDFHAGGQDRAARIYKVAVPMVLNLEVMATSEEEALEEAVRKAEGVNADRDGSPSIVGVREP